MEGYCVVLYDRKKRQEVGLCRKANVNSSVEDFEIVLIGKTYWECVPQSSISCEEDVRSGPTRYSR